MLPLLNLVLLVRLHLTYQNFPHILRLLALRVFHYVSARLMLRDVSIVPRDILCIYVDFPSFLFLTVQE